MAIKNKEGRVRSERSAEEITSLIKREFAQLSPEERQAVMLCLEELDAPEPVEELGLTKIYDALADAEYSHKPVDIETFVMDPYYLGRTCDVLYPKLLEDMKELFHGGYSEAILTGSIGWGKTFFASIAACRVLYELSCMRNPHRSFGIGPGTDISFVVLSVKEDLAIKVAFENIITKIGESDYFKEHFPFKSMKREIIFPNKIQVAARASTDSAALGLNVFAAMIDESNFMQPIKKGSVDARVGGTDRAQFLYNQLIRRMKSRFQRHGKLPGMMIVVSSKQTKDDFTAKRVRESHDDPAVFVRDYATWHVKPKGIYSEETFKVLVGNDQIPSKILEPGEERALRKHLQDGLLIVDVPIDFRKDFEDNLEDAIRDVAGVETVTVSPFIQQRDKILPCIDSSRSHPFSSVEWVQTESGIVQWGKLAQRVEYRDAGAPPDADPVEEWQPLHHPGASRHIHIDPSINTDCTGFAMGCVTGYKTIVRRDLKTNKQYTEPAPVIWVDFLLRVRPPVGGEIDHGLIRNLVYQIQDHGFYVSLVTMDQFNSAPTIQKFNTKGINSELMSVDKPMDPYDTLKAAIYENRVFFYEYSPLLDELRTIQKDHKKNKVDHPRDGSKDVADALAGIVFSLTTMHHGAPMGIVKGLSKTSDPVVSEQEEMVDGTEFLMPFVQG